MATITPTLTAIGNEPPGDGLCLFFFDPRYEFYPAGPGSALGYCNSTQMLGYVPPRGMEVPAPATIDGIPGAYLGIGFDVKGNFSTTNDGKPGKTILGTENAAMTSCTMATLNPNSICVRTGELSSYRIFSTTPNLSTYGIMSPTLSGHERYSQSPPIVLHQQVTSRDDITFQSVKATIQNDGKRIKVEIKSPIDGLYYPYQVVDLPGGFENRDGIELYKVPTTIRAGLAFSTSNSVMNCEVKNFSVQGHFAEYSKVNTLLSPSISAKYKVVLSGDCP